MFLLTYGELYDLRRQASCDSREAEREEASVIWWAGLVRCGICGHSHVCVMEIDDTSSEPIVPSECTECHGMTCYPEEQEDD